MSCPSSDAKRPGAAPKALGVCFSDFFGVGNLWLLAALKLPYEFSHVMWLRKMHNLCERATFLIEFFKWGAPETS